MIRFRSAFRAEETVLRPVAFRYVFGEHLYERVGNANCKGGLQRELSDYTACAFVRRLWVQSVKHLQHLLGWRRAMERHVQWQYPPGVILCRELLPHIQKREDVRILRVVRQGEMEKRGLVVHLDHCASVCDVLRQRDRVPEPLAVERQLLSGGGGTLDIRELDFQIQHDGVGRHVHPVSLAPWRQHVEVQAPAALLDDLHVRLIMPLVHVVVFRRIPRLQTVNGRVGVGISLQVAGVAAFQEGVDNVREGLVPKRVLDDRRSGISECPSRQYRLDQCGGVGAEEHYDNRHLQFSLHGDVQREVACFVGHCSCPWVGTNQRFYGRLRFARFFQGRVEGKVPVDFYVHRLRVSIKHVNEDNHHTAVEGRLPDNLVQRPPGQHPGMVPLATGRWVETKEFGHRLDVLGV
mmetsp:Transcript_74703/g.207703  ORF Transcript_74703/g.207703 Transcript_74703/m.207703 type:complete len:407 (-) Transcript_74703:390-1610(-)